MPPSNIDDTQPPHGNATTAAVRQNFTAAKAEIEELQAGQLQSPNELLITYTGSLFQPLVYNDWPVLRMSPIGAHAGQVALTNLPAAIPSGIQYTEANALKKPGLQTLSYDNLVVSVLSMPINCQQLTSLSFPELKYSTTAFGTQNLSILTTLNVPKLEIIMSNVFLTNLPALPQLNFPELKYINAQLNIAGGTALTTLYTPKLEVINGLFTLTGSPSLTAIDMPELNYIGGTTTVTGSPALLTYSTPKMIEYNGAINIATGNTNLATIILGTIGVTKRIPSNLTLTNLKLTQASVDAILALCASLDGTNNTESYAAGKVINLTGGTSSAPSAAGLASKATLVARGVTVTHN